ncbi:MAG: 3-hydroxybutyrate dehydrogenase [Polyangiaceae bacterium]|nr:3-hydroxybutyrate dehydrogenase [Polyangiaceae bacterium]
MTTFSGKVALVTGSTSGIGLGIARAFAARGAHVLLNGFGNVEAALADVRGAASEPDARVLHHPADMSRPSEVDAMMRYADDVFGGVDILVNNAGIQHVAPVEAFAPERWDAVLAINLTSAFHTMRLALPRMRDKGWGRIVNVASVHGLVASAYKAAYVAAKHGLVGLTKVVALETARTNITCNAICPGWVLTPLVQAQVEARAASSHLALETARDELLSEKQPSGQFVTPEQLAELVVFLSSDAAAQVRGVAWTMDGAWTAQ